MKKKKTFFGIAGTFFMLSIFMFTLTSKIPDEGEFEDDPIPCEDIIGAGINRTLRINFNDAQNPNPFRKSGYENYTPDPDLRWNDFPGAPALSNDLYDPNSANYYASVTITTPQCDNWEWKRVFDMSNGNSSGEMQVKVPTTDYDIRVKIKYYERIDAVLGVPNFNQDVYNGYCDTVSFPSFELLVIPNI